MDGQEQSFIGKLKVICRDLVTSHIQGESELFELIWGSFEDILEGWGREKPGELLLLKIDDGLIGSLAFAKGTEMNLVTPCAVAILICSLFRLAGSKQKDKLSDQSIQKVMAQCSHELTKASSLTANIHNGIAVMLKEAFQFLEADLQQYRVTADVGPEPTPLVLEGCYSIWTEEGHRYVTEQEYMKKYAVPPGQQEKEPLVWVNLRTTTYSIWKKGRRWEIALSGEKGKLFCIFLRRFNESIPIKELESKVDYYHQVYQQMHEPTFHVLEPFIDKKSGESRTLRSYSKYNRTRRFTFCLIEPYETKSNSK